MQKELIHGEDRHLRSLLARIQGQAVERKWDPAAPLYGGPVPEPNRSSLLGFYRSMAAEELSVGHITAVLGQIYRVSIWVNHRPFGELKRDDVVDLVEKVKGMNIKTIAKATVHERYTDGTIEGYKTSIKKFWRWLKNPDLMPSELKEMPFPPEVSWIRSKRNKGKLLPKDIWTPEEISAAAGLAGNVRDRAFVLGLFGSGCRIGEFLAIRRGDYQFDQYSCQILVDGKTGPRRVRLTPAASVAAAAWLDVHPNKDPQAPVWISIHVRNSIPNEHLSYSWAVETLKYLARRAGVNKPIRPHLMRHSLATYYASRLTEAVMNEHFGWRQGGRTAAIYTHLSGRQVDDQILAVFGRKKIDLETGKAMDIVDCPRCGLPNPAVAQQCGKCGMALSTEAAMQLSQRRDKAEAILDAVTGDAEVMAAVKKALDRMSREEAGAIERNGRMGKPVAGNQAS